MGPFRSPMKICLLKSYLKSLEISELEQKAILKERKNLVAELRAYNIKHAFLLNIFIIYFAYILNIFI